MTPPPSPPKNEPKNHGSIQRASEELSTENYSSAITITAIEGLQDHSLIVSEHSTPPALNQPPGISQRILIYCGRPGRNLKEKTGNGDLDIIDFSGRQGCFHSLLAALTKLPVTM